MLYSICWQKTILQNLSLFLVCTSDSSDITYALGNVDFYANEIQSCADRPRDSLKKRKKRKWLRHGDINLETITYSFICIVLPMIAFLQINYLVNEKHKLVFNKFLVIISVPYILIQIIVAIMQQLLVTRDEKVVETMNPQSLYTACIPSLIYFSSSIIYKSYICTVQPKQENYYNKLEDLSRKNN